MCDVDGDGSYGGCCAASDVSAPAFDDVPPKNDAMDITDSFYLRRTLPQL